MKKILVSLFLFFSLPAAAQWQVPEGTSPWGLGPGKTGFGYIPAGSMPINVKAPPYNAKGNGTTDDTNAITRAITAAGCSNSIYFPTGTYKITSTLAATCAHWFGDGEYSSIVFLGASADWLMTLGPQTGTTTSGGNTIQRMQFLGNSHGTLGCISARNVFQTVWDHVHIQGCLGDGLRTWTSTASVNTNLANNSYTSINSFANGGHGFHFTGEKQPFLDKLRALSNGVHGFYFDDYLTDGGIGNDGNEEYLVGTLISETNGGSGYLFDSSERFMAATLFSISNTFYGMSLASTITAGGRQNTLRITSFTARNDHTGALDISAVANAGTLNFGNVDVLAAGNVGTVAVRLAGVTNSHFGSLEVTGWNGPAVLIQKSNLRESSNINFGSIRLLGNGNVGSGLQNNGLQLADNSSGITVDTFVSQNNLTDGTAYELLTSAGSGISIGNAIISPISPSGLMSASGNSVRIQTLNGGTVWSGSGGSISSCGTGAALLGTDRAGQITFGTASTGCVLTFNQPFLTGGRCVVTSQDNLGFTYAVSTTALTITNVDDLSGKKVNYDCSGY